MAELLGDTTAPARGFAPEEVALGFTNNADVLTISGLLVEQYKTAAEKLAAASAENLTALLPCDPTPDPAACGAKFIAEFGERAFRRPLDAEQQARFEQTFQWGLQNQDLRAGVEMVIEAMLQSASFLYRVELGEGAPSQGVVAVSEWELASRLSYLLRGGMPDAPLFAAARAGRLKTAAELEAQARRLLGLPEVKAVVEHFHDEWLDLSHVLGIERDPALYPGFVQASVPPALLEEARAFVGHIFWQADSTLSSLLTAPYTVVNSELAAFYGLPDPGTTEFTQVSTGSPRRAGLLGLGAIAAAHAKPQETSPVHRGKFVREQLFCQALPPPPPDLIIVAPELSATLSTRERFSQHSADPSCAACHALIDPIGFGFEELDPVGRWREMENGKPISAAGELLATDVNGTFDGVAELGQRLSQSQQVADCLTLQWFRYAFGRSETPEDFCSLAQVRGALSQNESRMDTLLVALTQTDAFRYRKAVTP